MGGDLLGQLLLKLRGGGLGEDPVREPSLVAVFPEQVPQEQTLIDGVPRPAGVERARAAPTQVQQIGAQPSSTRAELPAHSGTASRVAF